MTKLTNITHETEEWPTDFVETAIIALNNAATIAQSASSYITARTLRRRTERKLRMYLEKIGLDLEQDKELGMQLECSE